MVNEITSLELGAELAPEFGHSPAVGTDIVKSLMRRIRRRVQRGERVELVHGIALERRTIAAHTQKVPNPDGSMREVFVPEHYAVRVTVSPHFFEEVSLPEDDFNSVL